MTEQVLAELFNRWLLGQLSGQEEIELFASIKDPALEPVWQELIDSAYDNLPESFSMDALQADTIFNRIIKKHAPVRRMFTWRKIAVAASVLFLIGLGSYFLVNKKTKTENVVATVPVIKAPTTSHAIITLSGGQQIILDSNASGTLAKQGAVEITKLGNGDISYEGRASKEISFNTLTNPRGSRVVTITLNDGTKVWLNAESSLRYPTAFAGHNRKVEITGEAYFEVAHNANMPFIVTKGSTSVQVLGTHFNVNAYDDEPEIKVTLLEGSVNVSTNIGFKLLSPNEQAVITNANILLNKDADINNIMAWKNGKFDFGSSAGLAQIMRQIARWYDIEVVYQGNIPSQHFGGEMPRNSDLNQVLEILKTSGVNFSIQNKKVIVMP
jgi:transmembrane sensor